MKKFLYTVLAAAAVLATAACQREQQNEAQDEGLVDVTFDIGFDGMQTKAFADGKAVHALNWYVYHMEGETPTYLESASGNKADAFSGTEGKENVTIRLVRGEKYKVVFWAKNAAAATAYSIATETGVLTVNVEGLKANDDTRDAFYAVVDVKDPSTAISVPLKRPFAQVNVFTTEADWTAASANGITAIRSDMTVKAPTQMNLITGVVDATDATQKDYVFGENAITEASIVTGYKYVAMNYILPPASNTSVYFSVYKSEGKKVGTKPTEVKNVPFKANYRTNILGNIYTVEGTLTVSLSPGFDGTLVPAGETQTIPAGSVTKIQNQAAMVSIAAVTGQNYNYEATVEKSGGSVDMTDFKSDAGLSPAYVTSSNEAVLKPNATSPLQLDVVGVGTAFITVHYNAMLDGTETKTDPANYNSADFVIKMDVVGTLTGIKLDASKVAKLQYETTDKFADADWAGLKVFAVYDNNENNAIELTDLKDVTVAPETPESFATKAGTDKIKVTYKEKTATYNVTVVAKLYTITINQPKEGGTIEADKETAAASAEVTLTPKPAEGFKFVKWIVKDEDTNDVTVKDNKFTMPAMAVTVTATFAPITIADVKAIEGLSSSEKEVDMVLGEVVVTGVDGSNVYVEDATGGLLLYKSNHGMVKGKSYTGIKVTKVKLFNTLTEVTDFTVPETSKDAEIPVIVKTVEEVSSKYLALQSQHVKMAAVTFDAAAPAGSTSTVSVSQNGKQVNVFIKFKPTEAEAIIKGSVADVTGYVSYYKNTPQITVLSADDVNVTYTPPVITANDVKDVSAEGGKLDIAATITNHDGWSKEVEVDGTVVTAADPWSENKIPCTVAANDGASRDGWVKLTLTKEGKTDITKTIKVSQLAAAAVTKYAINVATGLTGGSIAVKGNLTESPEGETITLQATPDKDYMLESWTVTEATSGKTVTVTNNAFTMPADAVNVSATFVKGAIVTINKTTITAKGVGFPTATDTTEGTYTIDGYSFSFNAQLAFYWSGSYLMLGKTNSYILTPAISGVRLKKIQFLTGSNASEKVVVDIYSADGTSSMGINNATLKKGTEYNWSMNNSDLNTSYQIRVTNNYNAQFQNIVLTYGE